MREAITRLAASMDTRDLFAFVGLACLALAAAAFAWSAAGPVVGCAAGVAVIGAGLFYLGVFHGRRQ